MEAQVADMLGRSYNRLTLWEKARAEFQGEQAV